MNRREFLVSGAGAAVTVISACAPGIPLIYGMQTGTSIHVQKPVAELNTIGGAIRIDAAESGRILLLRRTSENEFRAMSLECTHLGCTVRVEGDQMRCPCHGSAYDLQGHVINGPADRPLTVYPVRQSSSEYIVDLHTPPAKNE